MIWQDFVMAACTVCFSFSLVPTIIQSWNTGKVGIAWSTLIITIVAMTTLIVCYFTLNPPLVFTGAFSIGTDLCWIILLWLKMQGEDGPNV